MKFFLAIIISFSLSTSALACSVGANYKSPYKHGTKMRDVSVFRANVSNNKVAFVNKLACRQLEYEIIEHIAGDEILAPSTDFCWKVVDGDAEPAGKAKMNEFMGFKKGADVFVGLIKRERNAEIDWPLGFSEYVIFVPTCYPMHMNLDELPTDEDIYPFDHVAKFVNKIKKDFLENPDMLLVDNKSF